MKLFLPFALLCACALADPPPAAPAAPPVPEAIMPTRTIRIESVDDYPAAKAALAELVYGEEPGGRLEVVFAAGRYAGPTLALDGRSAPLDLAVRAEGEVVLDGAALEVFGREVTVSGFTFTGQRSFYLFQAGGAVSVRASDLHFRDAHVRPQRRGDALRGALANVEALQPGATMVLDGWSIESSGVPGASLVYLWTQPNAAVDATLSGWRVAGAEAATVVHASVVDRLSLVDGRFQVPEGGRLLRVFQARGPVTVEGGEVDGALGDVPVDGVE